MPYIVTGKFRHHTSAAECCELVKLVYGIEASIIDGTKWQGPNMIWVVSFGMLSDETRESIAQDILNAYNVMLFCDLVKE